MAIFRNRPLAIACDVLILSVAGSFLLSAFLSLILACTLFFLLIVFGILFGLRRMRYAQLIVLLVAVFLALGVGRVLIERHYVNEKVASHIGGEVSVCFEVEEVYSRSSYGSTLRVELSELNGSPCHVKAILITDDFTPFYLCDRVSGKFLCSALDESVLYEDQTTTYVADGAYVALTSVENGEVRLLESGNGSFLSRLSDFRELLHHRLVSVVNGESGELLSALVLGTRSALEKSTVRDFRRIGISHLLALSGLHLTILLGIADRFLSCFGIGKRWRILCLTVFAFGYLLLTGFSYSMFRAVLMLTLLRLSFLIKEDYDAFTALCSVGAFMALLTPCAIFDLSFQMTMLATFGILSFGKLQARLTRWIPQAKGIKGVASYALRAVISSLLITFSATAAILPVQWLTFGEISLLAPASNLLMIPLATVALAVGLLTLLLLSIPALASVAALPVGAITTLMLKLASALSPTDCMLSLQYDFVPYVLVPFFIITAVLLLIDLKKLDFMVLSPMALTIVAFLICLSVSHHVGKAEMTLIYRNTGSNEGILLIQNDTALICDVSNGSYTQLYEDLRLLKENCATEVEILMLTHYHSRQVTSISRFCDSAMLRSLWLPTPTTQEEREVLIELLNVAERKHIPVTVYEHNSALTVFQSGKIVVSEPLFEKRSIEPALHLEFSFGEQKAVYQSAALSEYERHAEKEHLVTGNYLFLSSHGPLPHEAVAPQVASTPDEVVIASEKVLLKYETPLDTAHVLYPNVKIYVLE